MVEAWSYELATHIDFENNQYSNFKYHLTEYKPNIPEGSIRNLKHLVEEKEWQPIETAPKDQPILAVYISHTTTKPKQVVVKWNEKGYWSVSKNEDGKQLSWISANRIIHWQPLPNLPIGLK